MIELMVGIVVMAILVAMAMPSFQIMLRNSEVRAAAESITNGLLRARAEAVARNTNVQFVLGPYPPTCNGAGSSWTVDYVVKPVAGAPPIDARCSTEGSTHVAIAATPTAATTVTFNSLGVAAANQDGSAQLTQLDLSAVGASQNLRVEIGAGGNAKMCDPSLPAGSTSPSAC
jgi:type IV fimbrial biogenesis protein FimT